MLIAVALAAASAARGAEPGDDRTFRPTVVIRGERSQGSGTVIASVPGETLVLTAAHVVEEGGPFAVELHRYNLGLERSRRASGAWPRRIPAAVVAADHAADLAVLQIRGMTRLPFVARLAPEAALPAPGAVVTSVGIDLGERLSSWATRIAEVERFEIEGRGAERDFLVTQRAPEHGRSGGGLFLENGDLVGVCVGRADIAAGQASGVFASGTSIHRLLRDHDLSVLAGSTRPSRRPLPPRARSSDSSCSSPERYGNLRASGRVRCACQNALVRSQYTDYGGG